MVWLRLHHPWVVGRGAGPGWAIVVACAVIGGLLGLLYYVVVPRVYAAEASVLVLPTSAGTDSSVGGGRTGEVQIQTEAAVAESAQVAEAAAEALDFPVTAEELRRSVTVTTTPNSQVLVVRAEGDSAAQVRDAAQGVAQAYLDRRSADAAAALDDAQAGLKEQSEILQDSLEEKTAALNAAGGSDARLEAELTLIVDQISDINSRLVALEVQGTEGGQVISAAALPTSPISPVLWLDVLVGMLLGALVGSGILLWRQRSHTHGVVESPATRGQPSSVAAAGSAAVVTRAPSEAPVAADKGASPAPVTVASSDTRQNKATSPENPTSAEASIKPVIVAWDVDLNGVVADDAHEAALQLRSRIAQAGDGPVVVVGVEYSALMAWAAHTLADEFRRVDGEVVVVLSEPSAPTIPGRDAIDGPGLNDVVGRGLAVKGVIARSPGHAAVVGSGYEGVELPPATQRRRVAELWRELGESYGTIVSHVQAPFDSGLARAIVKSSACVIVAVKRGISQQEDLTFAVEQLTNLELDGRLIGVMTVAGPPSEPGSSDASGEDEADVVERNGVDRGKRSPRASKELSALGGTDAAD